jgi:hypothetical protein
MAWMVYVDRLELLPEPEPPPEELHAARTPVQSAAADSPARTRRACWPRGRQLLTDFSP